MQMRLRNLIIKIQYFAMGYSLACAIGGYAQYVWAMNFGIVCMWINLWLKDNTNANNKSNF